MLKIRFMEERDRSEVFSMMREFHSSDAVIYTASDEILHRDISDCIGDMPFIEGFVFEDADSNGLRWALNEAFELWSKQRSWFSVRTVAMEQDFSWRLAAHRYEDLYRKILAN